MLDLCCGLGGASRAMRERGWRVIGIDSEEGVTPDVVADVRHLPLSPFKVDLLWASPPCNEFANPRNWGKGPSWRPDLSVFQAVHDLIAAWEPRYWLVENVWKARPYVTPLLGRVIARPPGHAIWGNVPLLLPLTKPHKGRWWGPWSERFTPHGTERIRALIPYEISLAVARAVEGRVDDNR